MTNIPNKEMTQEEVMRLLSSYKVNYGGEAVICETDREDTLYKIFTKHGKPTIMSDNKAKKINKLYELNLDYSVKPIRTISLDGVLIGYEMTSDLAYETYKLYQLSNKEKINVLKKSKVILDYFAKNGVIYGDLDLRNILINKDTGDIMFCDMDNAQVGEYPMDIMPSSLEDYALTRGVDKTTHAYMLNDMSLRAFDLDVYCSGRREITKKFKWPANRIVSSMKDPKDFNGEYLVSYIR